MTSYETNDREVLERLGYDPELVNSLLQEVPKSAVNQNQHGAPARSSPQTRPQTRPQAGPHAAHGSVLVTRNDHQVAIAPTRRVERLGGDEDEGVGNKEEWWVV